MLIYLLRPSLTETGSDHLTLEGRQIIRALGNKIRLTEEPVFDRFITAPTPAAVQTAELFADRTDYVGLIEVLPLLVGSTPASIIASTLLERGSKMVIVADEPLLATIGAFLVGRPTFPPAVPSQVSVIEDRRAAWALKPGEPTKSQLLVA